MSVRGNVVSWDWPSQLVHALGSAKLDDIEKEANTRALSLALAPQVLRYDVATWIAEGMPGTEFFADDPVRQRVAGVSVATRHGEVLDIKPAPRRAVGPDWLGVAIGSGKELGEVRAAWLTLFPKHPERIKSYLFAQEDDAHAALANMRGAGVRLFGAAVVARDEAFVLSLRFRGPETRITACNEVARDYARRFGGKETHAVELPIRASIYAPSEELLRLGEGKS